MDDGMDGWKKLHDHDVYLSCAPTGVSITASGIRGGFIVGTILPLLYVIYLVASGWYSYKLGF
jgi:hypothetical protein